MSSEARAEASGENPLIAPKLLCYYTPEEYHAYVSGMYQMRAKKTSAKPTSGVSGLNLSRSKKGTLSLRRTKLRAFAYVTMAELVKLAAHAKASQAEVWNLFKARGFIVAKDRMEAERSFAQLKEIPWD